MSDDTVSLHERLREADRDRDAGNYGVRYQFWATGDQLAAIQEAIEAPWGERAERMEAERDEWRTMAFADRNFAVDLRLELIEAEKKHDALKARADALYAAGDALRHEVEIEQETERSGSAKDYELGEILADWMRAAKAYDAAERAGTRKEYGWPIYTNAAGLPEVSVVCEGCHETQYYWPLNDAGELELSPSEIGCECAADRAGETQDPKAVTFPVALEDVTPEHLMPRWDPTMTFCQPAAPSPTDAAAESEEDDRNEVEWLTAQVAELQHWREGVDQDLFDPMGGGVHLAQFVHDLTWSDTAHGMKLIELEKRLDALRGPEVTDEDMATFLRMSGIGKPVNDGTLSQAVRAGLEAVAALRAGEAKE